MMMMKPNALWRAMAFAGLGALALSGCGSDGSDGSDGEDGKPGPIGVAIGDAVAVTASVTSASVSEDGLLTLNFDLADPNGVAVYGLKNTDIGAVSFGRLGNEDEVDSTDLVGEPRDIWLSYFNKDKGNGHFTGSSYFQGKDCETCLTDNGEGSYTLVLDKAIDTIGFDYGFKGDVTNGAYLGIKATGKAGATLVDNSFYYWQPDSDTKMERPKEVIADTSCQSCHRPGHDGALAKHGGKHVTLESCTFCHTDYNRYDKEGVVFDGSMKGMAHDIHSHSFFADDGIYPQMASNCQTCHQADESLPLADAWKADKDSATCLNCHNSVYAVPGWHWDPANDQIKEDMVNCVTCHGQGARGAEAGHYTDNTNARATELKVIFDSMTVAGDGSSITAIFKVMDGDEMVPLSQIDPRDYKYGGKSSAIVLNGVLEDDFLVNYQKVGVALPGVGSEPSFATQLSDGRIEVVIPDASINPDGFKVKELVDAGATITLSSQLHVCFGSKGVRADCVVDGEGNLTGQDAPYLVSDTFYFNQDGTAVTDTPRIQHAEMGACQDCHTTSITHRYTNDMDGCASCHNGTRDKKGTGSSNLAYIVHSNHYLGGFFKKTDCATCHGDKGFSLSLITADAEPVAFGKVVIGEELDYKGEIAPTFGEQTFVSPQAAACVSCHQKPYGLSDATIAHINQMGGAVRFNSATLSDGTVVTGYGLTEAEYDAANVNETCATCHKDQQILEAHSNWSSSH